jgi:hypothetical protein
MQSGERKEMSQNTLQYGSGYSFVEYQNYKLLNSSRLRKLPRKRVVPVECRPTKEDNICTHDPRRQKTLINLISKQSKLKLQNSYISSRYWSTFTC